MEGQLHATAIAGADCLELGTRETAGSCVLHALRPDYPLTLPLSGDGRMQVGEVYFSEVNPGCVRAWKRHKRQTQHFCVPCGSLGLVLYDDREASPTKGALVRLVLGRRDFYGLVRIPRGVWYGFCALGDTPALVCNMTDMPHDPAEGEKLEYTLPEAGFISFDWTNADNFAR